VLTRFQVIADLWEQYMRLLDQYSAEGRATADGFVALTHAKETRTNSTFKQRCHGHTGTEPVLLPSYGHDSCRFDRKTSTVRYVLAVVEGEANSAQIQSS
jgi:phosphoketolase